MNDEIIDFIAENTFQYYQNQNTETSYTDTLKLEFEKVEVSIANLVKALEAGIFNESTKTRMEELDQQKSDLNRLLLKLNYLTDYA